MFALDKFAYLRMSLLPRVNIFETDRSRKRLNKRYKKNRTRKIDPVFCHHNAFEKV